jgi:hypothetical protein
MANTYTLIEAKTLGSATAETGVGMADTTDSLTLSITVDN